MDEKLDKRLKGIHRNLAIAASAMAGAMTSLSRIEELGHLEALSSRERQPDTASPTTDSPSAAGEESIGVKTQRLSLQRGDQPPESFLAERCSGCVEALAASWAELWTHVRAAHGGTLIFLRPGSGPSAKVEAPAQSPSNELTEERLQRDFSFLNNKLDRAWEAIRALTDHTNKS